MFDCQSLLPLAFVHHDKRDSKAFGRACAHLQRAVEKQPTSARLRRMLDTVHILQAMLGRHAGAAIQATRQLARQSRDEGFDFEAATNLLAVLARMSGTEIQLPDGDA